MSEVLHGPTRGQRKIAQSFTNFVKSAPKNLITYSFRKFTEAGAVKFVDKCESHSWEAVINQTDVEEKVREFNKIMQKYMEECFLLTTATRRASDPPWAKDPPFMITTAGPTGGEN